MASLWYEVPHQRTRVCTTLCDMLRDRGYALVLDDGRLTANEQTRLADCPLVGVDDDGRLAAVYFCHDVKMNVGSVRYLCELLAEVDRLDCVVTVVQIAGTPVALKEMRAEPRINLFNFGELMYNVTNNVAVSRHRRVADPTAVLAQCRSKVEQLPHVYTDDPTARYFNWPAGTVVEIERRLGGFEQKKYALVIERPP